MSKSSLQFDSRRLFLPELDWWLDPHRPVNQAFVSHAHADHFARHERIVCSEATAHLLASRFGVAQSRLDGHPFEEPWEENGHRLCLYPAGHIVGSAMLWVEKGGESLLFTGDFKSRASLTAESPVFVKAQTLVMESTFGRSSFVFPPLEEIQREILSFVHGALADGETPVLFGYSLGKAQEAIAMLAAEGIPMVQAKPVYEMSRAVAELGQIFLPEPVLLEKSIPAGVAVVAPPNAVRSTVLRRQKNKRTAMLSGWALTPGAKFRYQVDEVFALSDHADFPGLLEAVEKVAPKLVYTLHGSTREFASALRQRGIEAWSIYGDDQLEMLPMNEEAEVVRCYARPACELQELSDLLETLVENPARLKKVATLATFLETLVEDQLESVLDWLIHPPVKGLGHTVIKQSLLEATCSPLARYKTISAQQNEMARTARVLLENAELEPEPTSFEQLGDFFQRLRQADGAMAMTRLLADRLRTLHPREGETLVRLLSGGLRAGAKEGLFEEAVAEAFGAKANEVRYAAMLTGHLGQVAVLAREGIVSQATFTAGVPIKPMLASPAEDVAEILAWNPQENLWLEPKYDGIRSQLHVVDGEAHLFSRDLRSLDAEFPELLIEASQLPDCVLDGEIIAYAEGKKLTFFDLQKRLGRKRVQADLFLGDTIPVRFVAFDCLYAGRPLIDEALRDRRLALERLCLTGSLSCLPCHRTAEARDLDRHFKEALSDGHEGLMVKDEASPYSPGKRGRTWRKLKGVMLTLDCVVVAAQQGHGKRAGVLSDYTFAVRDAGDDSLKVLGKAYSGLTDLEIEELTEHFQKTTIERVNRRVVKVEPQIVLEIAFDKIRPSKRHDSGLALRFPRIKAIRRDKEIGEIDTLATARQLAGIKG